MVAPCRLAAFLPASSLFKASVIFSHFCNEFPPLGLLLLLLFVVVLFVASSFLSVFSFVTSSISLTLLSFISSIFTSGFLLITSSK